MTRSKYPNFERVGSGQLKAGDRVLIRENADDRHVLYGQDGVDWRKKRRIQPGIYTLRVINSRLNPGWKRSTRYYLLTFEEQDAVKGGFVEIEVSSVQRINRVIGDA